MPGSARPELVEGLLLVPTAQSQAGTEADGWEWFDRSTSGGLPSAKRGLLRVILKAQPKNPGRGRWPSADRGIGNDYRPRFLVEDSPERQEI